MAKITKPKDKGKFFDSRVTSVEDFLNRSGIPAGVEHAAALKKIRKYYVSGGMHWVESLQTVIEEYRVERATKQLKEVAKKNAQEQAEDQRRYNAVLKSAADAAKAAKRAATEAAKKKTEVESPAPAAAAPTAPPPMAATAVDKKVSSAATDKHIGILDALLAEQNRLEGGETELSHAVLGKGDKKGVRSQIEQLVSDSREQIGDQDDPENAANFEVIETALDLSEAALRTKDRKQQVSIYNQLKFIRQSSEKTTGSKSEISKKLAEIIKPVEDILKKKTGFSAFAKERLSETMKGMPAAVAQHIPVVGGMLSGFLNEKRAGKEELESNVGAITQGISKGGHRMGYLRDLLEGRKKGKTGMMAGGESSPISTSSPLSSISSAIGGGGGREESPTLGRIAADVAKIRKVIVGSATPSLSDIFGSGAGAAAGGVGDMGTVANTATDAGLGYGLKKGWSATKGLASKAWGGMKNMVGMGGGEAASGAATGIGKSAAAGGGGGWMSKAFSGAKSLIGKGADAVSSVASSAMKSISSLSPTKQIAKIVSGSAKGLAKFVMKAPVLGSIISGIISAAEIRSIKNDPNLTPEQKKEKIGVGLMQMLGGIGGTALGTWLGGAGGAALGSVVPVLGTAAGGWVGSLVGAMGGEWLGKTILGSLGESLGGKEIYDIASSIPGIASMIDVGGGSGGAGAVGSTEGATGMISAPTTPNTTLGQQTAAMESARNDVNSAKTQAAAQQNNAYSGGKSVSNSNVSNQNNTTVNNYNDDIRIRNNEPTLKTMERNSM